MSIDFTVVCIAPRPTDWGDDFAFREGPFAFDLLRFDDWRQGQGWLDRASGDEFTARVGKLLEDHPPSFVGTFTCHSSASQLIAECAQDLLRAFGGFFFDDCSDFIEEAGSEPKPVAGAEIVARWRARWKGGAEAERARHEAAVAAFRERSKDDPSYAEANDWSDVLD